MVGVLTHVQLRAALAEAGVQFNSYAETLLDSTVFDDPSPQTVAVVERSVAELGLLDGGTMPEVFAAAQARALALCPPGDTFLFSVAATNQDTALRQEVAQVRAGLHGENDELVSTVENEDHCLE